MLTGILWGMGKTCSENILSVKYHESRGNYRIIGITADIPYRSSVLDYPYISVDDIDKKDIDFIVVLADGDTFAGIKRIALEHGFEEYRIWSYRPFKQICFDADKYLAIRELNPTIFSRNCWGGATYHTLGLEFTSPFINMFESDDDFVRFLKNPKHYINDTELSLREMKREPVLGFDYPVVECGDILLHFNHSKSFDSARNDWNRRKTRINWDSLFVEMNTEKPDLADEFSHLPYDRKICFVPFETDREGLCTVDFYDKVIGKEKYFSNIVVGMALGAYQFYDVFELILNGRAV